MREGLKDRPIIEADAARYRALLPYAKMQKARRGELSIHYNQFTKNPCYLRGALGLPRS